MVSRWSSISRRPLPRDVAPSLFPVLMRSLSRPSVVYCAFSPVTRACVYKNPRTYVFVYEKNRQVPADQPRHEIQQDDERHRQQAHHQKPETIAARPVNCPRAACCLNCRRRTPRAVRIGGTGRRARSRRNREAETGGQRSTPIRYDAGAWRGRWKGEGDRVTRRGK